VFDKLRMIAVICLLAYMANCKREKYEPQTHWQTTEVVDQSHSYVYSSVRTSDYDLNVPLFNS